MKNIASIADQIVESSIVDQVIQAGGFRPPQPSTRTQGLPASSWTTWKVRKDPTDPDEKFAKPGEHVQVRNEKGDWVKAVMKEDGKFEILETK